MLRIRDVYPESWIRIFSEIWSWMFILDPGSWFVTNLGFRAQNGTGSWISDPDPQHCIDYVSWKTLGWRSPTASPSPAPRTSPWTTRTSSWPWWEGTIHQIKINFFSKPCYPFVLGFIPSPFLPGTLYRIPVSVFWSKHSFVLFFWVEMKMQVRLCKKDLWDRLKT